MLSSSWTETWASHCHAPRSRHIAIRDKIHATPLAVAGTASDNPKDEDGQRPDTARRHVRSDCKIGNAMGVGFLLGDFLGLTGVRAGRRLPDATRLDIAGLKRSALNRA